MQVSLSSSKGLKRELSVTVPADRIKKIYDQKLAKVKKTAKFDGFRPGKVPNSVVESRFGDSVHQEAVSELLRETLFEAIKQEDLNPAGMPTITKLEAEKGKPLEYTATFEVYPEIKLKGLKGVKVERSEAELSDKDINEVLEKLRKQHVEWVEVDRASKEGDQVIIDFDGTCKKEPIEGGKATEVPLELGSGSMIPGFEDGIVGMKAGDEKKIKVTFPKEYHAEKLAGQKAEFLIKVHKVSEPKLPDLNDALAEKFGVKEGGLEAMKKDMRKHMETELENGLKMLNKTAVLDKLLEKNDIEVPEALVESEMQNMHQQSQQYQPKEKQQPLTEEGKKYLREPALRRVKLGLLVAEVVKTHELKVNEDQVKAMIEKMSGSYEDPAEFTRWYMADQQRVAQIEAVVMEDLVVDALFNEATVESKKVSYDDVVKSQQAQ